MDPDDLRWQWQSLYLVKERKGCLLTDLFKSCGGDLRGGIMFYNHQDEIVILKCEEGGHCLKKVDDTGDDEKDWEWIGDIVDEDTRPII